MLPGSLLIFTIRDDAPEARVTTRKTCMTWKAKYAFCVKSSTRAKLGSPASFAQTIYC